MKNNTSDYKETGRSMAEMLGVLAIMGILSATGITGYHYAMNSLQANTILNELNKRVHTCVAQLVLMNKTECSLSEYPDKIEDEYQVSTTGHNNNPDAFEIHLSDIPKRICQHIKSKGFPLAGKIEPENCGNINQMKFVFNTDLNGKECQADSDCTVCGHCVQGLCTETCETPAPDDENNCGENECVVYDEKTNSCQYKCIQKEWLENINKDYINTGISTTNTTKWEIKVAFTTTQKTQLMGAGHAGSSRFNIGIDNEHFRFGFGSGWTTIIDIPDTAVHIWTLDTINKSGSVDGTTRTRADDLEGGSTILLFNRSYLSSALPDSYPCYCKIYASKIWQGDELVRDFVPVLAPDGEPAMFDKVSQKLFRNFGTGEFKTN